MTRKAHNVDRHMTAEARFQDKRSYWTNPSFDGQGHEYLFGEDVRVRRTEVFERAKGKCEECGISVSWSYGHMHHKQGGLVGRCTCMHNLAWICAECHAKHHVAPRWGVKVLATD